MFNIFSSFKYYLIDLFSKAFFTVLKAIQNSVRGDDSRSSGEFAIERCEQIRCGYHIPTLLVDWAPRHRYHSVLHVARDKLGGCRRCWIYARLHTFTR